MTATETTSVVVAKHPARFSDDILETIAVRVRGADLVLDPFAGTGRVHELRVRAGVAHTIGIELEPEWASMHPDTIVGNALDLPFADGTTAVIATSPTFGNRMADHHEARDRSDRVTYRHRLGRALHPDNSGGMQWGPEYRDFHRRAWAEAVRVLAPGGLFVLDIKDHIRSGIKQEVAAFHLDVLGRELRLELVALDVIATRGVMAGENATVRVTAELVATFRKRRER